MGEYLFNQSLRRLPFTWTGPKVKFSGRSSRGVWIAARENDIACYDDGDERVAEVADKAAQVDPLND